MRVRKRTSLVVSSGSFNSASAFNLTAALPIPLRRLSHDCPSNGPAPRAPRSPPQTQPPGLHPLPHRPQPPHAVERPRTLA
jgi:hypothetical protein